MRKLAASILFAFLAAAALGAESPDAPASFTRYTMSAAGIEYPDGWQVSGMEGGGLAVAFFAPDKGLEDPFDSTDIEGLLDRGSAFALFLIATPQMADTLSIGTGEIESIIDSAVNRLGPEGEAVRIEDTSLGGLAGKLKTGSWGGEEAATASVAAAKTGQGSIVLFVCLSTDAEGERFDEAFSRMRQSITIGGTALPKAGGGPGYGRLRNATLLIDYPGDWHPVWLETPELKVALFTSMELDFASLEEMDFPPADFRQTMAVVVMASGETGADVGGMLASGMEEMLDSLGSDPKAVERGPINLAGTAGTWLSATVTSSTDQRIGAYIAGISDAKKGAVIFLGLSPVQDFTKAKRQFETMIKSFTLQ